MTLRARPVARRRGRAGWDSGDRRNNLINLGFFLAIGLSVLILVGYSVWSWYDDHYGSAAVVNGQVITKDALRERIKIEGFRLNYAESRIRTLMANGRISTEDGAQQISFISQRRDQLANLSLERLVDIALMTKLAADNGVQVTDADIDAQLVQEATTPEQRRTWMIEIEPEVDPDTGESTDAQKGAALIRAQQALGRLSRGESWEDVAKTASDSALAAQGGDLGFLTKESGYDEAFMEAVFAAEINQPTDIVEGKDGTYRIGRYTEVDPEFVDPDFQAAIAEDGIALADYRIAVQGDVVRTKLSEKITADLSKAGPQRHVLQIRLPEPNTSSIETELGVKVRWIAFAPNDSMADAADLKDDDPAWAKAKADAERFEGILKASPARFDELARSSSDEASGKRNGGKQPWIYASASIDAALKNAIIGSTDPLGTILAPIKGDDAWFVVQILRRSADEEAWIDGLKTKATDEATFRQLARDNAENGTVKGVAAGDMAAGDIGWITRGQLADQLDKAIFDTAIGAVSEPVEVSGDGKYLFWIIAEETREPTQDQLDIIKDTGFSSWYNREKEKAKIDYTLGTSATGG